jgi:hypothetical protein
VDHHVRPGRISGLVDGSFIASRQADGTVSISVSIGQLESGREDYAGIEIVLGQEPARALADSWRGRDPDGLATSTAPARCQVGVKWPAH